MAHIVIIGAGIAGVPSAYGLRKKLSKKHSITLIGSSPYFEFTPSNPWIAVGWRNVDATRVELSPHLSRKGITFIHQPVKAINGETNRLTLENDSVVDYDYLVITTGPHLAFDEIPGLGPNGYSQSICTQEHAVKAWMEYQQFLTNPGPIVIGAAPGASCFGPAYEFAMIIDSDLRKRKMRDRVPMTFVTSEPYIGHMGLGGIGDSRGLMESELRQRHIKWITNAKIKQLREGEIDVCELNNDGSILIEHSLKFNYSMIIPAFKGIDAVASVPELNNPRGFVVIDNHQRSNKYKNIYSAGVCVAIPPVESTPVPTGAPKTGYMIESMVSALCENIASEIQGKPATAQATLNAICLADFGNTGAAFIALPQLPPRNTTWAKVGKWVHVAKIAFEKYFLRKVRTGNTDPVYEKYVLKALGIETLKQ